MPRKSFFSHATFLFLLAILLVAGCGQIARGPALKPGETRVEVIQEILLKNAQKFHTLQGRGRLVVESPQQSFSGQATVSIKNPDSIFVRVEAVLGLDIGLIFADRRQFLIFSPTENLAYIGGQSDTLRLASFLGFDLTFDDMRQSMSGLALLKDMQAAKMKTKEDGLHVIGIADSIFYDYTIDVQHGLIARVEMKDFAGRLLRIEEYKRLTTINGVRIPQMVRFIRPRERESLTIFYDQLQINKPIAARQFYIKLPPDVLKIRL